MTMENIGNDIRFEEAIRKILIDRKINHINDYENVFLYFSSTIIQNIFCKLSVRINDFHRYRERNIIYTIFESRTYAHIYVFNRRYCHLYSEFSHFNSENDSYICKKCTSKKPCLIIHVNENEFYHYFNFLFNDLNLK